MEDQGHGEAGEDLQGDGAHGEDQAVAHDLAEVVVVDEIDVVPETDEALGIAHELVGERQPDGAIERVDDQGHDQDEEGKQEEQGGAEIARACEAARRRLRAGRAVGADPSVTRRGDGN